MYQVHSIKWKPLVISILIALGVGGLAGLLSMGSMDIYTRYATPPLAPPGFLFPIVWTILYILMGISAYLVYKSDSPIKNQALTIYGIQLLLNFIWPILFFNLEALTAAFVWILILWIFIIIMIVLFYQVQPLAGLLQIPYLLWVTFAAYLNLGIVLLNE